jgi:hypothetical protein
MFWNVENFFDSADDPSVADDDFTAFGKMRWGRKRFDKKRNAIAKTIISVADRYGTFPVVVGLAEVENYGVLWRLVNLTPLSKLGYGIIHMDSRDRRGIDVAMLYRKENFKPLCVDFVEVEMPDTTRHTRLILCCKGVFSDRCEDTVQFIVVHFPSKYGGERASSPGRVAACRTLSSCADTSCTVIAMGDFNAPFDELAPGLGNFVHVEAFNWKGTVKYRGEWESIDHFILGSKNGCRGMPADSALFRSVVYDAPFLLEDDAAYLGVKPFRAYVGPRYNGGVSDHLPVLLIWGSGFREIFTKDEKVTR